MSNLTFEDIKEDLYSDEIVQKIDAIHKLHVVAENMGKDYCINKLIPELELWIKDNDDEALCNFAQELSEFTTVLPGDEIEVTAPLLKSLAHVEEVTVRDAACDSFVKLINIVSPSILVSSIFPLIKTMIDDEWFTARSSVSHLLIPFFKRIQDYDAPEAAEQKKEIVEFFFILCHDETPMTKRAGANIFMDAIETFGDDQLERMIELYRNFYDDGNDAICMIALSACSTLLKHAKEQQDRDNILSIFKNCLTNKSWKLRSKAAEEIGHIIDECSREEVTKYLFNAYTALLRDHENEVKIQATKQISNIFKAVDYELFKNEVLIDVKQLCTDMNNQVKEGIIQSIIDILNMKTEETQRALPDLEDMFCTLADDNTSSVRLIIVSNIDTLLAYPAFLKDLEPVFADKNNSWRIREQIISHLNGLISSYNDEEIACIVLPLYTEALTDTVNSVRLAARNILITIINEKGDAWVEKNIYPELVKLYDLHPTYLIKGNILYTYSIIYQHSHNEQLKTEILSRFFKSMTDATPNIRFICCKIFIDIYKALPSTELKSLVQPHVESLLNDPDLDVKYYARLAMDTFQE